MRSAPLLFVFALALTAISSPARLARADEPAPADPGRVATTPAPASAPPERWYGTQQVMADLGSVAMLIAGGQVQGPGGETLALLGGTGFVLASPLIHLGHEHPDKALGALVLRLLVPAGAFFTGALTGMLVTSGQTNDGEGFGPQFNGAITGAVLGGLSGTILAVCIDDFVLAREPIRPVRPPAEAHATVEPRIAGVRGGATFGIGGTF